MPGNFIGSAIFLEKETDFPALATIVSTEQARLMTWNKNELRKLLEKDSEFRAAVEATLSMEIVDFLARAWHREALGKKGAKQS